MKCAHKVESKSGRMRQCKRKAEPGSKYCWQHKNGRRSHKCCGL